MFPVGQTASRSSMTDQVLLLWIALLVPAQAVEDNQALGMPTWQSSTYLSTNGPETAVDGNTDGHMNKGDMCTHTEAGAPNPHWWLVDLQRDVLISRVVLFNRENCCSEKLTQFHLELHQNNPQICGSDTMVTSLYQDTALPIGPTTFTFEPARAARWVQIIKPTHRSALVLCEVQVFGQPLLTSAAGPCAHCQSSPMVLPQLPPLTTHASLSMGNASPTDCNSLCLHHGQCLGFYFRPVVGGPPACTLLVPRPPGAPEEAGLQGPVTYFEMTC